MRAKVKRNGALAVKKDIVTAKLDAIEKTEDAAMELCRMLAEKTAERTMLLDEIREQRKRIYNLSMEINELHSKNEELMKHRMQ